MRVEFSPRHFCRTEKCPSSWEHSIGPQVSYRFTPLCHSTQEIVGPIISHIRNPYPAFLGGVHDFHGHLYPGLGRPYGGFPDFGCLDPLKMQAPHQCAGAQGGNIKALQHWVSVLQDHHVITTDNTTVVAYINKQGGTHSNTPLWLVVDLFLWLQTQDIAILARHIPGCLNVIADHISRPNQPIATEWIASD